MALRYLIVFAALSVASAQTAANPCSIGYCGAACQTCCPGFTGQGCKPCSIATNCNGNAISIDPQTCMCTCKDGYAGPDCSKCLENYAGYSRGVCRRCDSVSDCNGNGVSFQDPSNPDFCACRCNAPWYGDRCDKCPDNYEQSSCSACHADAITISSAPLVCSPRCVASEVCPTPLGVYASKVTNTAGKEVCSCVCAPNVGSAVGGVSLCDRCAPAYFYKEAARSAVVLTAPAQCRLCPCSGHGVPIGGDGISECTCACSGRWGPPSGTYTSPPCNQCEDPNFDATTCSRCMPGRLAPDCTVDCDTVCGVKAMPPRAAPSTATSGDQTRCLCSCLPGYSGEGCRQCASGYYASASNAAGSITCTACDGDVFLAAKGTTCKFSRGYTSDPLSGECGCVCIDGYTGTYCDKCDASRGYVGYPNCRRCNTALDCNSHAVAVLTDLSVDPPCRCQCAGAWRGPRCDMCDPRYDQASCASCAANHVGYPACVRCTCNGRALSVSTDPLRERCVCECAKGFTCRNPPCETCDLCDASAGYIAVESTSSTPNNCTQCSSEQFCNGHAERVSVSADGKTCVCHCAAGYAGATCDRCVSGRLAYPGCEACSVTGSCSGHATSVMAATDANSQPICLCKCAGQWQGDRCDMCPPQYDALAGCSQCAPGYVNYPACTECGTQCGPGAFATSNPNRTSCICDCVCNSTRCLTGERCSRCAPGYHSYPECRPCTISESCNIATTLTVTTNAATDTCTCGCASGYTGAQCDRCASGYHSFPACLPCSLDYCGGHTKAVAVAPDPSGSGCICTCAGGWDPASHCTICPERFDQSANCARCKGGLVNFPVCEPCSDKKHCNERGLASPSPSQNGCICECAEGYGGLKCETCAAGWKLSSASSGLTCIKCDLQQDCSAFGLSVASNSARTSCVCRCMIGYAGERCDTCAPGFRGTGSDGGPPCVACTVADCNYHAKAVVARGNRCECQCALPWTGETCDTCSIANSPGGRCECPAGFSNYPYCDRCSLGWVRQGAACRQCTIADDCSGAAVAVTSDSSGSTCKCTCHTGLGGNDCSICAEGFYRSGTECILCANEVHCSGRALSVSSVGNRCECTCGPRYTGSNCEKCAAGYLKPFCTPCSGAASCNNRALAVRASDDQTRCECSCQVGFSGDACQQCSPGFINWPTCTQCTDAVHCHGRLNGSITSDAIGGSCICTSCRGGWTGDDCGVCPSGNCDACPVGYIGQQPTCRKCSVAADCSPAAVNVTSAGNACVCTCRQGYAGPRCNECIPGYVGYPDCRPCDVQLDCNGRASTVEVSGNGKSCVCGCLSPWSGTTCERCLLPAAQCPPCGFGQVGSPGSCTPCTNEAHCSGHAVAVSTGASGKQCQCHCDVPFSGEQCNRCAVGFFGYPTCSACTSTEYCYGVGSAIFNGAGGACSCKCPTAYVGSRCEGCRLGYVGFPQCEPLRVGAARSQTQELALTSCVDRDDPPYEVVRSAMHSLLAQYSGAAVGHTRAAEPNATAGPTCRTFTFIAYNLPDKSGVAVEESLEVAVRDDPSLRSSLQVVGQLTKRSPIAAAPTGEGDVDTALFGAGWLTPPLFASFVVGGAFFVGLAFAILVCAGWGAARARRRTAVTKQRREAFREGERSEAARAALVIASWSFLVIVCLLSHQVCRSRRVAFGITE